MAKSVLYLHGFLSSTNARKAQILKKYINNYYKNIDVIVPSIPDKPMIAYDYLYELIVSNNNLLGIVGSSLGGFWATIFASIFNLPTVIINPVVSKHLEINPIKGNFVNLDTGNKFSLNEQDMEFAKQLSNKIDIEKIMYKTKVYLADSDTVLDHQLTAKFYQNCSLQYLYHESHLINNFEILCPDILNFLIEKNSSI